MSNSLEKEVAKTVRDYVEATENYNQLLDKYFPVRRVVPGVKITPGEPITEAALRELEEAEAKVTETRQRWNESLRRSQFEKHSP